MGDKRCIVKTNENLAWHLLLGVGPPPPTPAPLLAQISIHFLAHFLAPKMHLDHLRPMITIPSIQPSIPSVHPHIAVKTTSPLKI